MNKAEIPCPEVVLLKKHILVMSFIGKDHVPAPKLKDVVLSSEDMKSAFDQVLHVRTEVLLHVLYVYIIYNIFYVVMHEGSSKHSVLSVTVQSAFRWF